MVASALSLAYALARAADHLPAPPPEQHVRLGGHGRHSCGGCARSVAIGCMAN